MNSGARPAVVTSCRARASDISLPAGFIRDAYRDVVQRFGPTDIC
jgi:hypothetical protein